VICNGADLPSLVWGVRYSRCLFLQRTHPVFQTQWGAVETGKIKGATHLPITEQISPANRPIVRTALFLVVRCALGARYDVLPLMHQGAVAIGQPGRRWCMVSRGARRRGLLRHGHAVSLYDSASGGVVVALDLTTAQHLRRAEGSGYNTCKPHSLAQSLGEDTDGNDPWCRAGLTLFPRTK